MNEKTSVEELFDKYQRLTTKEAAKFLSVSEQTMLNWRAQRRGPKYFKLGLKSVRYKLKDLEDWLNERYIQPESN